MRQEAEPGHGPEPAAQTADVHLEKVSKRFGDVWALRPTTLSVRRGEFFSLLGASGSGKTTTLRLIGGFEEPTSGRVFLRERDVTESAPYERSVNTVFQDYALFPHMTVQDNVAYGLRVRGTGKAERRRRTGEALELVRLTGFERRRPSQLSGGQRQRVALARALVNVPAVLLLDEPLGALDLKLRREMQAELKRIQSEVGITFVYVTHDQEEAMSMSDRVAVMRDGQVEQIGTPTEVYEQPSSAFVAGFVGVSNMIEGVVQERSGSTYRIAVEGGQVMQAQSSRDLTAGQSVLLAVRPEKVRMQLGPVDLAPGKNTLRGRIADVSYGGRFTRYAVMSGGREMVVVEQNEGSGPRAAAGDEVWLSWLIGQTLVLPGSNEEVESGRRAAIPQS